MMTKEDEIAREEAQRSVKDVTNYFRKSLFGRKKPPVRQREVRISAVSAAIRKDYGAIINRRERRRLSKTQGIPFKAYYNEG